ncbi:MAG: hypothetical protein ABI553_11415, partial [Chloroflexota bacterium]
MWTHIDRARRRRTGAAPTDPAELAGTGHDATAAAGQAARPVEDAVIILGSHGLDQLRAALEEVLG